MFVLLCLLFTTVFVCTPVCAESSQAGLQIPQLNWQERFDWVNVKTDVEPKAIGDGKADDSAALQKALDGMTSGRTVYFPPGTYRITKPLLASSRAAGVSTGERALGVNLIGHGRDTRIVWDGEADGKMLTLNGLPYSQLVGLELDGANRASIGIYSFNTNAFVTELLFKHMAWKNFKSAGIHYESEIKDSSPTPDDYASAETTYDNCLFENCGLGVYSESFNDLNHTFTGCEFRQCGIGIRFGHGNFYVRDSHFEGSLDTDIVFTQAEVGCSLRRVTSEGSQRFLNFSSIVGTVIIQDCHVSHWKVASQLSAPSALLFDNSFENTDDTPVFVNSQHTRLVSSNRLGGKTTALFAKPPKTLIEIPPGQRSGSSLTSTQRFLKSTAEVPGKVFDVKTDFGAKGDGKADDTKALQAAIDAARAHGEGAIAYVPAGKYNVSEPLKVSGANYTVGGTGFGTILCWKGAEGGAYMEVTEPQNITLESMAIGHNNYNPNATNAADILQIGSEKVSRIRYDRLLVYGQYLNDPDKGIVLRNLGPKEQVILDQVQGNLHFEDSARATILANNTYDGTVTIEGQDQRRDGFLGFMTRLATIVSHVLVVKNNHSAVFSDFYLEQSLNGYLLSGQADDPPGRITVQSPKIHFTEEKKLIDESKMLTVDNYKGDFFLGPGEFYVEPVEMRFDLQGQAGANIFMVGNTFYNSRPVFLETSPQIKMYWVGNVNVGLTDKERVAAIKTNLPADQLQRLTPALDDLRRLGEMDLKLNFPEIK